VSDIVPQSSNYTELHRFLRHNCYGRISTKVSVYVYILETLHNIHPHDEPERLDFIALMLENVDASSEIPNIHFSDEATFHTNAVLNRVSSRFRGSEDRHGISRLVSSRR